MSFLVPAAALLSLVPGLAGDPAACAVAGALGLLGLFQGFAARRLRVNRLETASIVAVSLVICWILYGDWLDAKWSILDDHELFLYLGARARLSFFEAWQAFLGHYEALGVLGNTLGRFRPGYYLVRFMNLWLFGDKVAWWNRFDFAVLWISLSLAGLALRRIFGLAGAVLTVIALLGLPFWPGMLFSNLQQESVALLGLCLFAHGLSRCCGQGSASAWFEAAIGALLAMSLKENFLFLAPLLAAAAALAWRRGRLSRTSAICVAVALAYAVLACSLLIFLLERQGTDMYAHSVSAGARLPLIMPGLARFADAARLSWTLACLTPFLILGVLAWRDGRYPGLGRDLGRAGLALGASAFTFAGQFVFYDGLIPMGGHRYDFPALLAPPVAWLAMALLAMRCLRRSSRAARGAAPVILCTGLGLVAAAGGFAPWRAQLEIALAKTRAFDERIRAMAIYAKAEPDRPIELFARNPDTFEALDSVVVNLRKRLGVANRIFLDYKGPDLGQGEVYRRRLDAELSRLSRLGSTDISPLEQLPDDAKSFCLGFDTAPGPCAVNLGVIWPLP